MSNAKATNPPIPATQTPHDCTSYSLLCALFRAFTTILILVGIIALIFWLIFQPDDLTVYADKASLARFVLDANNNTLDYNLTVDISLRNPNKKIGIKYEHIKAVATYNGSNIGHEDFPRFHQHYKSTVMLRANFQGQAFAVANSTVSTYKREKKEGWFHVGVNMYTKVRLRRIFVTSVVYIPEVDCQLMIPVPSNAISGGGSSRRFMRTKCSVDSFR